MKCINKNLEPIKELLNDFKEPVLSKILDSFPDDYIPTKEEALKKYSELLGSSVDYKLKVINALQSDKVRNPLKNFQGFINDLEKQGVPKIQLDLIRDSYKQGDTKEDLISTMLANYSYTIEVNTAKKSIYPISPTTIIRDYDGASWEEPTDYKTYAIDQIWNEGIYEPNSPEFDNAVEKRIQDLKEQKEIKLDTPTQYYSNLTVPGGEEGTYKEQNFETPLIKVPKSHAQFNTENTIGFNRNDDRRIYTEKDIDLLLEIMKKSGILEVKC